MILHRDGGRRDVGTLPTSVPELARTLRRTRTRQGLRPEDVAARTGLPLHQIEALEAGSTDRLSDGVPCVRALRRYADFLGLPGDRYALALVELWPAVPTVPAAAPTIPADAAYGGPVTAMVAAAGPVTMLPPTQLGTVVGPPVGVPTGIAPAVGTTGIVPAVGTTGAVAVSDGGTTFFQPTPEDTGSKTTGSVRYVGGSGGPGAFAGGPPNMVDTGVTPAIGRPPGARRRRRATAGIIFLRLLVVVVALLLIAGLAGLGINHWRPQWLRSWHLPHSAITASPPSTTATGANTTTTAAAATHATSTTAPHAAAKGGKSHATSTTAANLFTVDSTTDAGVNATVHAPSFTVKVVPVGGASWVQVSDGSHPDPVFSDVVQPGQTETFANEQTLTVQVGSSAGRIFIYVGSKLVSYYFPSVAPFTLNLTSAP